MDPQLVQQLQDVHGLGTDQSHGIINTIVNFIKDKVPGASGMIDQALHGGSAATVPENDTTNTTVSTDTTASGGKEESFLEKVEDFAKSKLEGILPHGQ